MTEDRIAVYTAIGGAYNDLEPHPTAEGVDWIAFVDKATVDDRIINPEWDLRPLPHAANSRMAAKLPKVLPHVFLPEYDRTIWIDGTVKVETSLFPAEAAAALAVADLALWAHPERICIYAEAVASVRMAKYAAMPILEQVAHYASEGYPVDRGLWACGIMARRNTATMVTLMEDWWDEIESWTAQDQLSLPYCMWSLGFEPVEFPGSLYANPWITITGHNPDV